MEEIDVWINFKLFCGTYEKNDSQEENPNLSQDCIHSL